MVISASLLPLALGDDLMRRNDVGFRGTRSSGLYGRNWMRWGRLCRSILRRFNCSFSISLHAAFRPSESDVVLRTPRYIASEVAQPILDYTLATTRAATDLILTGTMSRYTNLKVNPSTHELHLWD